MKLTWRIIRRTLPSAAVAVLLLFYGTAIAQQPHTLTGDIRVHQNFHSNILDNDRDVILRLSPDHETNKKKRHSVCYMHDGQALAGDDDQERLEVWERSQLLRSGRRGTQ